jgi:hypothetical protein
VCRNLIGAQAKDLGGTVRDGVHNLLVAGLSYGEANVIPLRYKWKLRFSRYTHGKCTYEEAGVKDLLRRNEGSMKAL